jgi:hypothetical protein
MPIYKNALAKRPANLLAYEDTMSATPRNEYLGALADFLAQGYAPQRTQQMQGVAQFLSVPAISQTLDRLSYGEPLTTGAGMTTRVRPEALEAAMALAPLYRPVGMGVKGVESATMAAGRAGERYAEKVLPGVMERGGLPAQLVMDLTRGARSQALPPTKYVGKTLEGMPDVVNVGGRMEQFGTDQRLVDIAKSYVADKGLVYSPQTKYATIDENRATRLAQAYQGMVNNPNDPKVKKAYNAMINETMAQYEALRKKGYKFDFMPESGDIYGNPRNAINDIVQNKRLSIFPTEQGFGGPSAAVASEANPLLMRTGETWSGKPVTANDVFRAVHDVFGHGKHGVGFRAAGEENAFQSHARMYSPEALPAATSETRGQNSWVNFGPYGQSNRTASPLATEYAEQKTGIMPAWTWREGFLK